MLRYRLTPQTVKPLVGSRFGKWTVVAFYDMRGEYSRWVCRCDCGNEGVVFRCNLRTGHSYGCSECAAKRRTKHGHCRNRTWTRTYSIWHSMMGRCYIPSATGFPNYGGRGIRVCERWHDYKNFLADMGECPPGYQIDRIDNDGDYEPANCRWVTHAENQRNRPPPLYIRVNNRFAGSISRKQAVWHAKARSLS